MKIKNLLLFLVCLASNSTMISKLECAAAAKEDAEDKVGNDEFGILFSDSAIKQLKTGASPYLVINFSYPDEKEPGRNNEQINVTAETLQDPDGESFKFNKKPIGDQIFIKFNIQQKRYGKYLVNIHSFEVLGKTIIVEPGKVYKIS